MHLFSFITTNRLLIFVVLHAQIVYMDHADFNGRDEGIDYGRPRIHHVRQSDFALLENLDRRRTSRKAYGVLQVHFLCT